MENLKVAEIAEQLHESVSSIKSKLMRARKYTQKRIGGILVYEKSG